MAILNNRTKWHIRSRPKAGSGCCAGGVAPYPELIVGRLSVTPGEGVCPTEGVSGHDTSC